MHAMLTFVSHARDADRASDCPSPLPRSTLCRLYAVRFKHDGPLALTVSSPSSSACILGPFRKIGERALVLNHFLARTNFLRELSGLAALPESQSALVAYCGGRNDAVLQRALSIDVVRASEAQSWRHARTLKLLQCQGEEDPGRIAWEKANPSTAPAGSVAMLRCPQRQGKEDPGRIAWEKANPSTAPAGSVAMLRCPQRAPAGNKRRLDWENRQYAGLTKSKHHQAVAGLSKRQRIDSDQAKRIVDARPRCPCCEKTMEEGRHSNMKVSAVCLAHRLMDSRVRRPCSQHPPPTARCTEAHHEPPR
ncbi:hypothetical protein T492DRAFT_502128 [Pavlovales sp. CCMP2436]|nr:hypothetical protein T492DRAFT_502128 [Pavlovales sp. CCMP2436]